MAEYIHIRRKKEKPHSTVYESFISQTCKLEFCYFSANEFFSFPFRSIQWKGNFAP